MRKLRLRLRSVLRSSRVERELDEEMRYHVDRLVDDYVATGMAPRDARRAALRDMGPIESRKEECRDARGLALLDAVRKDVGYAWRSAWKSRGFSTVVVLTLAIGIGANAAVFSIVDGILLRPLPYRQPERLVVVRGIIGQIAHLYPTLPSNASQFLQWKQRAASFDGLSAVKPGRYTLTGNGTARSVGGARVSPNLLRTLGIELHAGRFFSEDEDTPGRDDVAVIGYDFWQERFDGRSDAIGSPMTLDDREYTIVGILPASFRFPRGDQLGALVNLPARIDVMRPLALTPHESTSFGEYDYLVIGRLRPGVTIDRALADLTAIQKQIAASIPARIDLRVAAFPMQDLVVGGVRQGLFLALAAVAAVLLIGCINLAALALARASSRLRECAVRIALGASRVRLMRQLLIENLLLAAVGGALGLALAKLMLDALVGTAPIDLPRLDEVRLDLRVASVAAALTAVTSVLFGLWPAWRLTRADPQEALQSMTRSATEGRAPRRLRSLLIATEVALTATLLVAAGLLVNSTIRLAYVDTGFSVDGIATTEITLSLARYPTPAARNTFYERLLAEVSAVPGVAAAGIGSRTPLSGEASVNTISRESDVGPELERPTANYRFVSPTYFSAMGMRLVAGRTFDERDRGRHVGVVSEKTANLLWPGGSALGKRYNQSGDSPFSEVVGIVGTSREVGLQNDPPLLVYEPYWMRSPVTASLVLRTSAPFAQVAPAVRAAIVRIDPQLPAAPIEPMRALMAASLAPRKFQIQLVGAFAMSALLLSCIGIYGALSYAIARRSTELAIRAALGARPGTLVAQMVSSGMKPAVVGLGAGLGGALAVGKGLGSLLFGVQPRDPATMVSAGAVLAVVALAACYVPAARAARLDPTRALRAE